jgi:NADH dehydrogenase
VSQAYGAIVPGIPGPAAGARARVVIVGAGFGGLECARGLDRATADVLLLDRGGCHLFTPLLYQVATALLNPSEIAYPLRAMFRKSPNVRVRATTVTGVDLSRRVVRAAPGAEIPYDYLVLASGSASDYHGNQQLADNSIGLKTLEDGTRRGRRSGTSTRARWPPSGATRPWRSCAAGCS